MKKLRVIPSYDLYGDQSSQAWSHSFNFEWIPQRSAPYQWLIHPHRHEAFMQLLYLTSGEVEFFIDDNRLHASAPCLAVIPAGHVHGFRFSSDVNGPVVTSSQKALESAVGVVMPEMLSTVRRPRLLALPDEMRYVDQLMPLFLALEQESRAHALGHTAVGTALLTALMVQVHRIALMLDASETAPLQVGSRRARQIDKFRLLADAHFRTQKSLQWYADQMGLSTGQLSRLCRDALGMSGLAVINARVIHEAQRYLVYTHLPIKQLAAELGYDDDAYFSRFFRKNVGVTPTAYRARVLSEMNSAARQTDLSESALHSGA